MPLNLHVRSYFKTNVHIFHLLNLWFSTKFIRRISVGRHIVDWWYSRWDHLLLGTNHINTGRPLQFAALGMKMSGKFTNRIHLSVRKILKKYRQILSTGLCLQPHITCCVHFTKTLFKSISSLNRCDGIVISGNKPGSYWTNKREYPQKLHNN